MTNLDNIDSFLDKSLKEYQEQYESLQTQSENLINRTDNILDFIDRTPQILNDLDNQFEKKTGLSFFEVEILFAVVGFQLLRQYLLTKFPLRLDDQISAKTTDGYVKTSSNRRHRYYEPSLEEIITNPVPFDANLGTNGALKGGGKLGHRVTAIGHDPLLGLIFGTANIATSTLTTNLFDSYHIKTINSRDAFTEKANTGLVLGYTIKKLLGPVDDKQKVAISFIKEIIHLRSDLHTHNSLPLPLISVIDGEFASRLANYGLDFSNVVTISKQAILANLINSLAAMYHYSFYDGEIDEELYRVKTKKIIMYSNIIASVTNLAAVGITKNVNLLDVGGIGVAIYETITSVKYRKKVKREFIIGRYDEMFEDL